MNQLMGVRRRSALAGLAMVTLMVVALTAAPLGTMAEEMLNRFRVQQFSAITIPMGVIENAQAQAQSLDPQMKTEIQAAMAGLGTFSTTLDLNSLAEVSSPADASAHLGRDFDAPSNLGSFAGAQPRVFTGEAGNAEYRLNVRQASQMLQAIGISAASLPDPDTTPTVTFGLDIQRSAAMVYEQNGQKLFVAETESPELQIPASVDIDQLRDDLLMFPLLPPDVVGQLRSVRDWKTTMIVPVPANATSSQVTVNGVSGLRITSPDGSAVLWQKDGILHVVASDVNVDVTAIANSTD